MFDPETINYELPSGRVPPKYSADRSDVKLLVLQKSSGKMLDKQFADVADFIKMGECFVNVAKYSKPLLPEQELEPLYAEDYPKTSIIPTAGVPFTEKILSKLALSCIALSTPPESRITTEESYLQNKSALEGYVILDVPDRNYRVTAIGTTVVKALETYSISYKRTGESDLLITPGFKFKCIDAMLTNFHYPKEILLAMTCAFGGTEFVMDAYRYAMSKGYRISDRGDRMLIIP